jgi:transposase
VSAVIRTQQAWVAEWVNAGKVVALIEQAELLGRVRTRMWDEYGALKRASFYSIRDRLMKDKTAGPAWQALGLSANAWKETASDAYGDIKAAWCAAAARVRDTSEFRKRYPCVCPGKDVNADAEADEKFKHRDDCLRWSAIWMLYFDNTAYWNYDPWLHRKMRKVLGRSHNHTFNQIMVRAGNYTVEEDERDSKLIWLSIPSLVRRHNIKIPVLGRIPTGTLRLIIEDDRRIRVCWAEDVKDRAQVQRVERLIGKGKIGVDKGYTDLLVDSSGQRYSEGFGEKLSEISDQRMERNRRRAHLSSVSNNANRKAKKQGKITDGRRSAKANRIVANNLGTKKRNKCESRDASQIKTACYTTAHQIFDKVETLGIEDLTWNPGKVRGTKKSRGSIWNRRLGQWTKGVLNRALKEVSERRGSTLVVVNAAYTSQIDHRDQSFGTRRGNLFYASNGDVLDADVNAANNVEQRMSDPDITRYMTAAVVKQILLSRNARCGLPTARTPVADAYSPEVIQATSTESELSYCVSNSVQQCATLLRN